MLWRIHQNQGGIKYYVERYVTFLGDFSLLLTVPYIESMKRENYSQHITSVQKQDSLKTKYQQFNFDTHVELHIRSSGIQPMIILVSDRKSVGVITYIHIRKKKNS